jgi:hypothetical protein
MSEDPDILRILELQAKSCRNLGSPLSGDLLDRAAADWRAGGPVRGLVAPWEGLNLRRQFEEATALRLLAALHDLALSGDDPDLSDAYASLDIARIWPAAEAAMRAQPERLAAFMTHEPQTNEVRRSMVLIGGFLEIARATGLPMRTFELGASAGLNISWDHFHYRFGEAAWGDPAARVQLDADWTGPAPPVDAQVEVIARAACDRRPGELSDPVQERRLLAYIWPDQLDRLVRLKAAIAEARANKIVVERADAAEWTRDRVDLQTGAATVLYHSVFWQYMPPGSRVATEAAISALGAKATAEAPFAWLRMEPDPDDLAQMALSLMLWPGGATRVLATAHPHGAWVRWSAAAA